MSDKRTLSRRDMCRGLLLVAAAAPAAQAQGFAGLGVAAGEFKKVEPGVALVFPRDHGAHPQFRIEWWYVTANLRGEDGAAYGAQWTLFRQAMAPGPQREGWGNQQIWMGHAALTSKDRHRFAERLARGGIGQAGVTIQPLHGWIDAWDLRGADAMSAETISPLRIAAAGTDFSYTLELTAARPLVLQGDAGYSRKSERGQASYYYSQPYFAADGQIAFGGTPLRVTGQAWMDREWSSQPLASDQKGWDWISLHLESGDRLMLFRLHQSDGSNYFAGNWIGQDGHSAALAPDAFTFKPLSRQRVAGRLLPLEWQIDIPSHHLSIRATPLNPQSWMATRIAYWEGPIAVQGSQSGVGYLEMTGY